MNRFLSIVFLVLFAAVSHAVEMGVPIQLKLKDPSGVYPDASGVTFTVRILTPNDGCVLREEAFSNQTVVSGTVSLALGTGSRAGDDPNLTLTQVYDNSTNKSGLDCVDINNNPGLLNQTYIPAATDTRVIRVSTTDLGTPIIVDFIQRATPYAIHAESVGGKVAADILVQNGSTALTQANLEDIFANPTKFNKLKNIAANGMADNAVTATTATNAANFTGNLTGDVTGTMSATVVGSIRGVVVAATAPASGQVLAYNGSQYVPMTFSASAPVSSVNGQTGAVVLNAATIGAVTSATSLLGDVTGNVSATVVSSVGGKSAAAVATAVTDVTSSTTLPTASTIARRDASGSLAAINLLATNNSTQNIYLFEGSNTNSVRLKAPNSFADYMLVLPTTDGNVGEVLQTDGNGNLSWIPGAGSVTSAAIVTALGYTPADGAIVLTKSNNLGDLVSATVARTNLGLSAAATMNVGTTAGTLAAGDDARITGALQQTAFDAYVAPASCTAGQSMYWNSVSSEFTCQNILVSGDISGIVSNATVTKVQGVGVSFAALANNHIMQYNGSNFVNRAIPTCGVGEYLTFNGTAWSCAVDAGGGGAVTSINVNAPISSTGGSTPTLSIVQANGSTNGYLASADWTTFNNKVSATSAAVIAALGYTPADNAASGSYVVKANNLSDLTSATAARTNLGLGGAAILNVGAAAGTVAAGDDARIADSLSQTNFNTYVAGASCTAGQSMYWNSVSSLFACQNILVSGDISGIVSNATVTKIQGVGASFSAIASNHILQYNGTNIINRAVPTCTATQYLTFNGTIWSCATDIGSAGVVSSIAVTAPLQTTGGNAPTLSMPQANGSTNGYLASADWTTFNNKITSSAASVAQVLGFSPANSATILVKSNNLSDLTNVVTARSNLGLGGFALVSSLDLGSASATGTLATARLPALTGDVTSTVGTNSLTVTKIQSVAVNAAAPEVGDALVYNGSEWIPTPGPRSNRVTANQNINGTTYVDVTSMNFPVVSGRTYKFKFNILYATSSTTRGLRLRINHGGSTAYSVLYSVPASTTYGTGYIAAGSYDASGDTFTAATATPAGIQFATAEGIIVASADGTVQLVASQSSTGNLTIYAGSVVEFREIP